MTYAIREYVRATRLPFSVVMQCVDPPQPVFYRNFADRKQALGLFERLKANEIKEGGGGEFSVILYEHTPATTFSYMTTTDETVRGDQHRFVYALDYACSTVVQSFTYMDFFEQMEPAEETAGRDIA